MRPDGRHPAVVSRWRHASERVDPDAYAIAFQLSEVPRALLATDGTIRVANAALGDLLAADPETLHGRRLHDFFPEGGGERADAFLQGALTWTEASREVTLLGEDGRELSAEIHARLADTAEGAPFLHFTAVDARGRRRQERVHALALDASRAANLAASPEQVGEGILRAVEGAMPELDHLAFFVHDEQRNALVVVAERGLGEMWQRDHGVQALHAGADSTLLAHASLRGESVFILDASAEAPEHPAGLPPDVGSILAVPIQAADDVVGALIAATSDDTRLDFDAVRSAEIAAAEAAGALQRLKATRQLASSETRYRAVVERVGDGVLVVDPDGHLIEANPLARRLFGWGAHPEGCPSHFADALPHGGAEVRDFLRRVSAEGRATDHFDLWCGERRRYVRVDGVRPDDRADRLVLIARDATAEVRDRRLRDLTASVQETIVDADPGALPASALARAAMDAAGAEAALYVSARDGRATLQGQAGRCGDLDVMEAPLAEWISEAVASGNLLLRTREAAAAEDLLHFTVLPAKAGERSFGVLVLAHARSDVAPFETADLPWLRVACDKLARGIRHHRANESVRAALTREREVLGRIRRLHEELKDFTLWTTHDLREPLRSLGTLAGFLREDLEGADLEEAEALARQIEKSAEALKERIFALHDFGVLMQEAKPVVPQNLEDVVDRVLAQLRPRIDERGAEVRVVTDLPVAEAQADRLDILLLNLVENAIKYGDPECPEVRIGARRRDGAVELFVEDNGAGLPPEAREQLFRPFFRRAEHRHLPGTGMGLAIVQRIASQHGGEAWVEDASAGGARFVVRIPDAEKE